MKIFGQHGKNCHPHLITITFILSTEGTEKSDYQDDMTTFRKFHEEVVFREIVENSKFGLVLM